MLGIYLFIFTGSALAFINLLISFHKKFKPERCLIHVRIATVLLLIPPVFFILYKPIWMVLAISSVILSLMNIMEKGKIGSKTPAIANLIGSSSNFMEQSLSFPIV